MRYAYHVFGIPLLSEIPLPALSPLNGGTSDETPIRVLAGKAGVPFTHPPTTERVLCRYNENEFCYTMPEVATFFVANGREIIVEAHTKDMESVLVFFYSNALAAALYQRNLLPFHASGIIGPSGKVWLFSAPSRVGKSTTALMLHERGYRWFNDDVLLIRFHEGKPMAYPSYPLLRLWENTLAAQEVFPSERVYQIRPAVEKYGVLVHETFDQRPREIEGMVFLDVAGDQTLLRKLRGREAFAKLNQNVYRSQWAQGMNKQRFLFDELSKIARSLSFWEATRPKGRPSFREFAETIDRELILAHG